MAWGSAASAQAAETRGRVLRAARSLFARHGYHGVGLREIAAAVGIRAPSLFKHFRGKTAIYNDVLLGIFDDLARLTEVLTGQGSFDERLERYIRGYARLIEEDPEFVPLILRELMERPEAIEPRTRARALEVHRCVEEFLQAGQEAGAFRRADRLSIHLILSGSILYRGLAAHSYLARVGGRKKRVDLDAWVATLLAMVK